MFTVSHISPLSLRLSHLPPHELSEYRELNISEQQQVHEVNGFITGELKYTATNNKIK